jgi:hypothetical protein
MPGLISPVSGHRVCHRLVRSGAGDTEAEAAGSPGSFRHRDAAIGEACG